MSAVELLKQLDELYCQKMIIDMDYNAKREQIMSVIAEQLAELDAEYKPLLESVAGKISEYESDVKDAVLLAGETVKGDNLMAVWSKGRVSWDTKALDGYATAHPEIDKFRKQGDPSVSIRKTGG